jgi:cellulose synthase/poly-beta-1,6-N-acetylglucosamine synthase-like glycosyltransferase
MRMHTPWHICVLIPARNEEALLPRCVRSLLVAKAALDSSATVDIIVVSDSSTDQTAQIATDMVGTNGTVLEIDAGTVGVARSVAALAGLARYKGPLERCWLANTDADSVVPATWLTEQIAQADKGIEAIAGTVSVDSFAEHGPQVRQRLKATYTVGLDGSHPHVHGANLGVRADAYRRAGGWGELATAEDHDLWRRLSVTGTVTLSTNRTEQRTCSAQ